MPDRPPRDISKEFIDATNDRDLARLAAIVRPDFEDAYPQSGERIRGFGNLRRIIENYRGGGYVGTGPERVVGVEDRWVMTPAFTMLRIEGAGDTFTGVSRGRYPDGSDWLIVTIGEVRDGRIWRCETYFAPTFDAPQMALAVDRSCCGSGPWERGRPGSMRAG
jgi:hypothetical protein